LVSRPVAIAALLYTAAGVTWTHLPLLHTLGFESSFATGLLTVCVAGPLAITLFRRGSGVPFVRNVGRILRSLLFLLAIPLVFLLLAMFGVKNCAPLEGAVFYLLLPVSTAVIAAAIGVCSAVFTRHAVPVYFLAVLILLAESLLTAYTTPAVFSYNLLYGYFPGATHDEALGIPSALPLFRLWTLTLAATLFLLGGLGHSGVPPEARTRERVRRVVARIASPRTRLMALGAGLVLLLGYWFRCELGFASTASYIRERLGGAAQSEHFTIFYDRDTFSEKEVRLLMQHHEFTLHRILDSFSLRTAGPYESFVYASTEQRLTLIGVGETSIARPWAGQIHLVRGTAEHMLAHELTHLVAARFGVSILNISLSPALLEGLAMAVEWDWGNRTLHEYAAAIVRFGAEHDPAAVLSMQGFLSRRASTSYVLAGSFCRYLIDRYGMRAVVRAYGDGDYEAAFGRTQKTLVGEWEAYLDQIPLVAADSAVVDISFRAPSLFAKICPRETALLRRQAGAALEGGDIGQARTLFGKAFAMSGDQASISGLVSTEVRLGDYRAALHTVDSVSSASPRPARAVPLFMAAGDAAWALGDTARAFELYAAVVNVDYAEQVTESAGLRLHALREGGHSAALLRFFLNGDPDTVRSAILDSLLLEDPANRCVLLLSARHRLRSGDATTALRRAGSFRMPDPLLEAVRLRTEARALFEVGRYQEAKARMWESLTYHGRQAAVDRIGVWTDFCDWMTRYGR
jgi:tetratricopeptide (TPR) repeat protein